MIKKYKNVSLTPDLTTPSRPFLSINSSAEFSFHLRTLPDSSDVCAQWSSTIAGFFAGSKSDPGNFTRKGYVGHGAGLNGLFTILYFPQGQPIDHTVFQNRKKSVDWVWFFIR